VSDVALWIGVGAVGGVGAILRFILDGAISARSESGFPLGTLAVNISGATLLGFLAGAFVTGDALLVGATGLLGSYTTFSTWMLESHRLSEDGQLSLASLNLVVSLAAGVAAVVLGRLIGGWL
jgi:CrcB protein